MNRKEELEGRVRNKLTNRLIADLKEIAINQAIKKEVKAEQMMANMAQYQAYTVEEMDRLYRENDRLVEKANQLAEVETKLANLQAEDEELSLTFDVYAEHMSTKIVELKHEIRGLKRGANDPDLGNKLADAEATLRYYQQEMAKLQHKQQILEDRLNLNRRELEDVGMFMDVTDLFYEEGDGERYKLELESNIAEQEVMVNDGVACSCSVQWTVGGSQRRGDTMTKNNIKLTLRCFNVECDNYISKISTRSNLDTVIEHLESSFRAMNRMMKPNSVKLDDRYLELKREQARIVYKQAMVRRAKREEEARQREILREQERVEKEIQAQKEKALREQANYLKEQQRLMQQENKTKALMNRIVELEEYINKLNNDIENLDQYSTVRLRSGYVYVISQPNSDQVKIGVTRRIEPMVRVQELSSASVPFKFNVHAMMFAEDAFQLEAKLHNHFAEYRVNKANSKKEFFNLTSQDVEAYIHAEIDSSVEFNHNPYNEEWEQTLKINKIILK